MSNGEDPAFPAPDAAEFDFGVQNRGAYCGMSLRDYFAAKAMAAMIASPFPNVSENVDVAAAAYAMADAMIGARK
jgi:hypothetical protein